MNLLDIPILTYHHITEEDLQNNPYRMAISVKQFDRQMNYLHNHGYSCLSLIELLEVSDDIRFRWNKPFIITFDDGYANFFNNAYPILSRYGFTATVFVVTDFVGKQSDWEGEKGNPMLTWEDIKTLHDNGISFGSHTCSHARLINLSCKQIWHELNYSKEKLESELDREIHFLAYPYGDSNREIQKMAMKAGYKVAFAALRGRKELFNLWRCLISSDDNLLAFVFKLSPLNRTLRWLRDETMASKFFRKIKHRLYKRLL